MENIYEYVWNFGHDFKTGVSYFCTVVVADVFIVVPYLEFKIIAVVARINTFVNNKKGTNSKLASRVKVKID